MRTRKIILKCKKCGTENAYYFNERFPTCRRCGNRLLAQTKLNETVTFKGSNSVLICW